MQDAVAEYGVWLRARRGALGWSRAECARAAGVSVSTVRELEEGEGDPSLQEMLSVCEALGATLTLSALPLASVPQAHAWPQQDAEAVLRDAGPQEGAQFLLEQLRDVGAGSTPERLAFANTVLTRWPTTPLTYRPWSSARSAHAVMLEALALLGDEDLLGRFFEEQLHLAPLDDQDLLEQLVRAAKLTHSHSFERALGQVIEHAARGRLREALGVLEALTRPAFDEVEQMSRLRADFCAGLLLHMMELPRGAQSVDIHGMQCVLSALMHRDCAEAAPILIRMLTQRPDLCVPHAALTPALLALRERWGKRVFEEHSALGSVRDVHVAMLRERVMVEPQPPQDLRREFAGCGCEACELIAQFMQDPHAQRLVFPAAHELRRHLHRLLDDFDVTHHTIRAGTPHSLDIVKTQRTYTQRLHMYRAELDALNRLKK